MIDTRVKRGEDLCDHNSLNKRKYRLLPQVTQHSAALTLIVVRTILYNNDAVCGRWLLSVKTSESDVVTDVVLVRSDIAELI